MAAGGASILAKCVVVEQLKHSILFPFGFAPNFPDVFILLESCKGAQIDKYLKPFLRGETQSCIAITEPSRAGRGRGRFRHSDARGKDERR